ncbi:hypothetical protein O1611_g949 [Lasiodiplodia mahajangana]|uniref:Uncharacterized protein n=1 Tax=Lasiodiplodia mahajangana TaxID=1108764 RepID=A0ACC2JYX9_9PEZI|nr:hypothetical protein O1611_g949 [Lasiodiplodia mahajangana]
MANCATFQTEGFIDADTLRTRFVTAMSAMYREEVPLYSNLIDIVREVNEPVMERGEGHQAERSKAVITVNVNANRVELERHGAIRLGKPQELHTIRRIFAVLGMHPFGYYDLSVAGLPLHATCFRPRDTSSLSRNAFRMFTTLLREDLLNSDAARDVALSLLGQRQIFTTELLKLLEIAEGQDGRLTSSQADVFIREALDTFRWHSKAAATEKQYNMLREEHPILADIACFRSAHINHLTPRTFDITAVQKMMCEAGMRAKEQIEGPPPRSCPILLRQTSFLALEEPISFLAESSVGHQSCAEAVGVWIQGSHTARFGEVEERGAAVTAKGRKLYDQLLNESMAKAAGSKAETWSEVMAETFKKYPDDWDILRQEGLIYCEYRVARRPIDAIKPGNHQNLLESLIQEGIVEYSPITYEDFLPFSAAGIFGSNLREGRENGGFLGPRKAVPNTEALEDALGDKLLDPDEQYARIESRSLKTIAKELGLAEEDLV